MRMRLREGLRINALPDGDAVVDLGSGATAVIVNATAHAILDLLTEGRTAEEVAAILQASFPGAGTEAIQRDVAQLLADLERSGIVEPCGGGSSTA